MTFCCVSAHFSDQVKVKPGATSESRFSGPVSASGGSSHRPHIQPNFDDDNRTVVIGSPGGTVVLDCRISQLQDYTVSGCHTYVYASQ